MTIKVRTLYDGSGPHPRAYLVLTLSTPGRRPRPGAPFTLHVGIFSEPMPTGWGHSIVVATAGVFRNNYDDSDDLAECMKVLADWTKHAHPDLYALLPERECHVCGGDKVVFRPGPAPSAIDMCQNCDGTGKERR